MVSLNNILQHIGPFGRFQQPVYILLNILTISQCCQKFLLVFIADKPHWSCSDQQELIDLKTKQQGYPCYKNGSVCQNISFNSEYSSLATEWKLICSQEYLLSVGQSAILAGGLVGALVFGGVADRYGRRFAIIFTQSFAAVFCLSSGFAQTYYQFAVMRFLVALFLIPGGMTIFVLFSEILGPSSRDFLLTLHQGFYSCGFVILALLAYFIPDWRTLTLVISLPSVVCSVFLYIVCESPQWFLQNGCLEEGKQLLKDMAKKNGTEIPKEELEELSKIDKKDKVSQSHGGVFVMKGLMKLITLSCIWCLFGILYNGLSYSSKSTSSDKYISFSLSGLVEIPSLFFSMLLLRSGRKMPIVYLAVSTAFTCFISVLLLGGEISKYGYFITLLVMFGKFSISAGYSILYIFSAQLFSVTVRNTSVSICSMAAHSGGVLVPLILYLELYDKRLPMFVYGSAAIFSAILILALPETLQDEMLSKKKVK